MESPANPGRFTESLGFHVEYDKSLGELYERHQNKSQKLKKIKQHQVDLLIDNCDAAISDIHRPIVKTKSATSAVIESNLGGRNLKVGGQINLNTHNYINEVAFSELPEKIEGRITSYNINTYKGRINVVEGGRHVSFELSENCRSDQAVHLILESLNENATLPYFSRQGVIRCKVVKITSRTDKLKKYKIINIL